MKEDSLLYFESPNELREFVKELDMYKKWSINEGLMNNRGKLIEGKVYTVELRTLFREKKFFRKNVSLAEIVSWLDGLSLIQRVLEKLENRLSADVFNSLEISVEYMIKMSKRMRIDYLILYRNNILLLELRTVSNFNKLRATWEKKFHELLVYKELMNNYLAHKDLKVYALISLYEYAGKQKVYRHIENNEKQLDYLTDYLIKYTIV